MDTSSSKTTAIGIASAMATTATVGQDLKNAASFGDFLVKNEDNMLTQTLSEHLTTLLKQKKLKRADVVRNSDLDKAYVYQIFSGKKNPSRDKLIAIAFGMHLNEEDTQRMLKLAGHSELYPRIGRDALILFAIQRGMSIWETDEALDKNGFPTLLSAE
ncbi:MAG: helix-turn-helix transcriptional regulator [Acetatifactor sp.]|nr:helix-turn-helix transcriptional regulator [Acetatifactor sp.]